MHISFNFEESPEGHWKVQLLHDDFNYLPEVFLSRLIQFDKVGIEYIETVILIAAYCYYINQSCGDNK